MSGKYPGGFVTLGAPAGFSVAFDGTGDYLTIPDNAAFTLGNSSFCIELWLYTSVTMTNYSNFIGQWANATTNCAYTFRISVSNAIQFAYTTNGNGQTGTTVDGVALTTGSWNHLVVCRNGANLAIFQNGIRTATNNISTNTISDSTRDQQIGFGTDGGAITGYMSNLRMVVGSSVYDPTQTTIRVPTQLFNISGTSLLTCNSPAIVDQSNNNLTITANGDAKVSNFTPFTGYTAGASGFRPALGAAAPGVWTLDEATTYQQNRQWPIYDPNFNQTTLMLHGNGTNGAQNNTFLDSSTNNFTITRVGNTTQGTFTPFSQTGWSTFFPSESGIYFAPQTYFDFSTGSNTIELWFYPTVASVAYNLLIANPYGVVNPLKWGFSVTSAGLLNLYRNVTFASTNAVSWNQWNHIALVTDISAGNTNATIRFYINGVASTLTGCDLSGWTNSGENIYFQDRGGDPFSTTYDCYMSNFRWVRSVVYTAPAIPVPTAPLTAIDNTRLLTLSTNNFVDLGGSKLPLTVGYGTPSVQSFSPFVPTVTTPVTYSNYFDGSGDYLTLPNNSAFGFGTGDFTIEAWYCFAGTIGTYQRPWWFGDDNDNAEINGSVIRVGGASQGTLITGTTTLVVNRWYHVALTRASGVYRLWLNGIQEGSSATNSYNSSARTLGIAATTGGANPITGNISNFRIVKGTALYTTSFTPPTSPLTNITNTSLLTCQSSTFVDNSSNNFTVTVAGNTQPRTSPVPFAPLVDQTTLNTAYSTTLVGGSAYFNGTSDYLSLNPSPFQTLYSTTVPFTLEVWLYPTAYPSSNISLISATTAANTNTGWWINITSGGVINWIINGVAVSAINQTAPLNSWSHYAVVWNGTTLTSYLNGSNVLSGSTTWTNNGSSNVSYIGTLLPGTYNYYYTGYLSGMRLVVGTQVYTRAFVPPSAPPTPVTNTQLLLNYTNAGVIDSTADNVLQTVGNAQISTTQSKYGGSSMYFNGSSGFLKFPPSQNFNFGGGDFTVEFWVYRVGAGSSGSDRLFQTADGDVYTGITVFESSGSISVFVSISGGSWDLSVALGTISNTWSHVAITRSGANFRTFLNGVNTTTNSLGTSALYFSPTQTPIIGGQTSGRVFNGYIDDFRITKGVARYTGNFTPPTSQLQDQ
jgi:hypothetical protein